MQLASNQRFAGLLGEDYIDGSPAYILNRQRVIRLQRDTVPPNIGLRAVVALTHPYFEIPRKGPYFDRVAVQCRKLHTYFGTLFRANAEFRVVTSTDHVRNAIALNARRNYNPDP